MNTATAPHATALPPYVQALGHGVYAVDTGFQRDDFDAGSETSTLHRTRPFNVNESTRVVC